ncbi:MAG TPA: penicillin-binding protein activator [Xanthobacteraceae bacterium]|nr:penicillin-binding protein activator [Xanthobacteraceae bacterium]
MSAELQVGATATTPSRRRALALLASAAGLLTGCSSSSIFSNSSLFSTTPPPQATNTPPAPAATIGTGQVKVGLILPLSAGGNASVAGQAMRNAADMALAEFNSPNIQLLVEDDAGNADTARTVAQQALDQGAEIILGPLFAQSVNVVGQVTRPRNIPVIAFSTDANVASAGIYLLSFLPESDVERIVQYAGSTGKRSFAALVPDNPYGTVVEAAFRQAVARHGGQIAALEHYSHDPAAMTAPVKAIAQAAVRADALFIPDGGDAVPSVVQMLVADGMNPKRIQLLGTGLWDDPRIYSAPALDGGLYAAPDAAGYRSFSARYRQRYNQDPVRTATLAYDAVALVAALVKTQQDPQQRFSPAVLTNPSGFTGIDGLFRFRPDGTNDRGLAVLRVAPSGPQTVSPPPRSFGTSGI